MNPLLEKTKAAILAKADPRLRPVIDKLVNAGEQVMYGDKSRELMVKQLGNGTDPELVGAGVAKLVGILYNQSKKTAPIQALIPAGVVLLCEGLQFLEDAGAKKIDAAFLDQCTMAMGSSVGQLFGATADKLQGLLDKSGQGAPPAPPTGPPPQAPGILAGAQQGVA